jgi:stage II sporulation protein D
MRRLLLAFVLLAAVVAVPAAAARTFAIEGRGWGHGVGMSQYGAQGFALHGWGYRRILAHYYPGTRLVRFRPQRVRVLLAQGHVRVDVRSRKPFRVRDARGRSWTLLAGRYRLGRGLHVRHVVLTPPVRFDPGAAPLSLDGHAYRGALVVHRFGRLLTVVNDVPLERYLRGVVPWEMPHEWNVQALAAQAVAARSYALATLDPAAHWDLVADTRDQVYGGIPAEHESTNRALGLTHGLVLTWHGRIALALYSSTSGGRTAALPDGLPGNRWVPYLVPVSDPYDAISPHHRWGPFVFRAATIARRLGLPGLTSIRPVRNGSGRVATVRVRWRGGGTTVPGRTFARRLDLLSTWFSIRSDRPATKERAERTRHEGGVRGWTVVLGSVPEQARREARTLAARARRASLPDVRILLSSRYPALRPGFLVVTSGVYGNSAQAGAAAVQARKQFATAYARRLGS